jgi:hypothetical protein
MRSSYILSLTAFALALGVAAASAAPIDFNLKADTMRANSTAGGVQPPAGVGLNQKGLAAIKPAVGQSSVSNLASSDALSSIARMGSDNMVRRPDSAENEIENNVLSGSNKAATENMLRPPSE